MLKDDRVSLRVDCLSIYRFKLAGGGDGDGDGHTKFTTQTLFCSISISSLTFCIRRGCSRVPIAKFNNLQG